jgi:actin-like ATPase involved in cell morphogenesis
MAVPAIRKTNSKINPVINETLNVFLRSEEDMFSVRPIKKGRLPRESVIKNIATKDFINGSMNCCIASILYHYKGTRASKLFVEQLSVC